MKDAFMRGFNNVFELAHLFGLSIVCIVGGTAAIMGMFLPTMATGFLAQDALKTEGMATTILTSLMIFLIPAVFCWITGLIGVRFFPNWRGQFAAYVVANNLFLVLLTAFVLGGAAGYLVMETGVFLGAENTLSMIPAGAVFLLTLFGVIYSGVEGGGKIWDYACARITR